jgi:hypothetical protein
MKRPIIVNVEPAGSKCDPKKLPLSLLAIWEKLKPGVTLCKQVAEVKGRAKPDKPSFEWFLHPTGEPVRSDAADGLARLGYIVTAGDGLFEGDSQTYRRADLPAWRNG